MWEGKGRGGTSSIYIFLGSCYLFCKLNYHFKKSNIIIQEYLLAFLLTQKMFFKIGMVMLVTKKSTHRRSEEFCLFGNVSIQITKSPASKQQEIKKSFFNVRIVHMRTLN